MVFDECLDPCIGRFDQVKRRIADFSDIVRRDRGRHTNRDPLRAIGEKVRKTAGEDDRFLVFFVIGVLEIDRVFVEPFQQEHARRGHLRFGVTHCGGAIAVNIAEIPLPFDQRITGREGL